MLRIMILGAAILGGTSAMAASDVQKQKDCQFQADLIGAVQQARIDRVRKAKVTETLVAANPDWPSGIAQALPAVTEYVYSIKRRDLKEVDLAASTLATCLENYEQIKEMGKNVSN